MPLSDFKHLKNYRDYNIRYVNGPVPWKMKEPVHRPRLGLLTLQFRTQAKPVTPVVEE